jgi:hypothetical protein
MKRAGGFECLLEVLRRHGMPIWLRTNGAVGRCHHLLFGALLVLVPLIAVMLGRCRVVTTIPTAELGGSFGLAAKVGLDRVLAGGVLGSDIQEFPCCAWGRRPYGSTGKGFGRT